MNIRFSVLSTFNREDKN